MIKLQKVLSSQGSHLDDLANKPNSLTYQTDNHTSYNGCRIILKRKHLQSDRNYKTKEVNS